jgi:hypothetical protein
MLLPWEPQIEPHQCSVAVRVYIGWVGPEPVVAVRVFGGQRPFPHGSSDGLVAAVQHRERPGCIEVVAKDRAYYQLTVFDANAGDRLIVEPYQFLVQGPLGSRTGVAEISSKQLAGLVVGIEFSHYTDVLSHALAATVVFVLTFCIRFSTKLTRGPCIARWDVAHPAISVISTGKVDHSKIYDPSTPG